MLWVHGYINPNMFKSYLNTMYMRAREDAREFTRKEEKGGEEGMKDGEGRRKEQRSISHFVYLRPYVVIFSSDMSVISFPSLHIYGMFCKRGPHALVPRGIH